MGGAGCYNGLEEDYIIEELDTAVLMNVAPVFTKVDTLSSYVDGNSA